MQIHTGIINLDEYGKGQGEKNSRTSSFCGGDDNHGCRHGVDWVDMSTPFLPEVVPEIDALSVSMMSLKWVMH